MADESDEVVKDDEVEEDLGADDKEEEEADEEVPVRKGNADFARTRIALKESKKEKESDDEELTDKAQKLIEAEVDKRVAHVTSGLENKMLLRDYLSEHPEHKKYEGKAQKYMAAHPTLVVEDIFKIVAPSVEPEEREKAIDKAKRGEVKGGTVRKGETTVAKTEADFKKIYQGVKRGEKGLAKQLGAE